MNERFNTHDISFFTGWKTAVIQLHTITHLMASEQVVKFLSNSCSMAKTLGSKVHDFGSLFIGANDALYNKYNHLSSIPTSQLVESYF